MAAIKDIIIIGGGSAGIAAALTATRRSKTVLVVANPNSTTALYKAPHIDNYPGFNGSGAELAEIMRRQLENSTAELVEGKALSVVPLGDSFGVAVGNDFYEGKTVIVCTGTGRLPICSGETEFLGRGVSYCATCDGMLYRGKTVAVLGNSAEAKNDAAFLRNIGCEVLEFSGMEKIDITGGMKADTLTVNGTEYKTDCIFILKDTITADSLISGLDNQRGVIYTQRDMSTSIAGIFAAGDCTGSPHQLGKAVGEGVTAAVSAVKYLDNKEKEI